jgi:beta-lactamase class A
MRRRTIFVVLLAWPLLVRAEEPALTPDPELQRSLEATVANLALTTPWRERRLAISLIDVTDPGRPRYAGLNDHEMLYAASLPKVAVLVAGFEKVAAGLLRYTPAVKEMFTRMVRYSSNADASLAIHKIGFEYIARVLTSAKYRLYDPVVNGGLWVGKAYGGPNDYWQRDPLHNISHGATSLQVARLFLLLDQGRLVSPEYSAEMKQILSKPGLHHKFVKGLEAKPGHEIYRKSGTWREWHSDAALIEHEDKRYIAVALMRDSRGSDIFPRLIQEMDALICGD